MNNLKHFRILLIDDRKDQYLLVRDFLSLSIHGKFDVDWASSFSEGQQRITQRYDVCLIDYDLGDSTGLDLIREVVARQIDLPMILITGHSDPELDMEALRAGAVDYLSKQDLKPSVLERSIRYAIERGRNVQALRASEARLRQVLETVTVGMFILQDERMVYVNPMMTIMTGYSAEELLAMHFLDLIDETLLEAHIPSELPLKSKNGSSLWVSMTTNAIEYMGKTALLGALVDVTRRREMDAALKDREKRFRSLIEKSHDYVLLVNAAGAITYVSPAAERITGYSEEQILGSSIEDFWQSSHPDDAQLMREQFAQLIRTERNTFIIMRSRLRHKDGSWLWLESVWTNLLTERSVEAIVMNVRDITESVRAWEAEHAQRKFAEALLDTSAALNSSLEFDVVLDRILRNVGNVIAHDGVNISLIEDGCARHVGWRGYDAATIEMIKPRCFMVEDTPTFAEMVETQQPLVISDTWTYDDWTPVKGFRHIRSYIGIPIIIAGQVIGFINIDSYTPHFYKPDDATRLQVFGDQAALAIQNARAFQQAKELAAAQERQRLARDLHDAVSQTLFSASVIAETLPRLMDYDPEEVKNGLNRLNRLTRGALAEMRTLLIELRPSDMVDIDLTTLIQHLVNGILSRTTASVQFNITGNEHKLPVDIKIALYRITQEALNNISKHARADHVEVALRWDNGQVALCIRDDGRGFSLTGIPASHMGVRIMHERASAANIALSIESEPGQGTVITGLWNNEVNYE